MLQEVGVYAAAAIKKGRYWSKHVSGNKIDDKMKDCELDKNKVMPGKLDRKQYRLYMMKEPAFVMKMMAAYGDLSTPSGQEKLGVILRATMVSNIIVNLNTQHFSLTILNTDPLLMTIIV